MPDAAYSTRLAGPILTDRDFEQFRVLAYDKFGLNLTDAKRDLVAVRLGKKVRELHLTSFRAYYEHVRSDTTGESMIALIDALSTNHTAFLREMPHFEFLRHQLIPKWRSRPRIEIWSAPCSTGEEPYSIAITLLDELGMPPRIPFRIWSTDISTRVLKAAQAGVYQPSRLIGLSDAQIQKYFEKSRDLYHVQPEVKRYLEFGRINLIEPIRGAASFPLIFCRNLMIYFDKGTQEALVNSLARHLEPGGYLFTGHSETLMNLRHPFEYVKPAIYRLPDHAGAGGKR